MRKVKKTVFGLLAMMPLALYAQVDLQVLDRDMLGPRAQVMVLGSVHLNNMPDGFKPAALDGLLERLAQFRPDIITVEDLPGAECDLGARQAAKYGADYCPSTALALAATGLDIPAALQAIEQTLKSWPAQPTAAQRRHVTALFLAANEQASAYLHWLQLPAAEQVSGDGLSPALVAQLVKMGQRNNESLQIAAVLGARRGLTRIHAVDNHTGDKIDVADEQALMRPLQAAWALAAPRLAALQQREQALNGAADLLPLYRLMNDPATLRMLAEANVVGAMASASPERYPQMWVAGWEIRNLRMVANIRESFRERPGARVLTIVGASHKPWFDAWLRQLQGVDIVDAAAFLK